ncbi:M20 aminoacylase family protein [Roseobacteraceae bacterium S113]
MAVINRIAGFAQEMAGWRRHIHAHPELGLECHDTARYVVARLKEFGVDEIHEGIAVSGVVGIIEGKGAGPVTGLRADMDALPMQEETGLDYASTVDGRMHACGHDGHTAMLLGAAKYLSETRNFTGKVALIFQPAEEVTGGGRIMVEEGMMERFGIEEVYGIHTNPLLPAGEMETSRGPLMAAVDDFYITFRGVGGHAAYPEGCVDPIPAIAALVGALQSVVSRKVSPHDAAVLTVTQIHAGTAINVIPEEAMICGTMRTLTPEVRALTEANLRTLVEGHASAYGMDLELTIDKGYPPTINHEAQALFAADVAREVAVEVRDDIHAEMGAEDFSYMLEARPGAYLFLGQGEGFGVHHSKFNFNDDVAPIGASFFARLIETRHGRG